MKTIKLTAALLTIGLLVGVIAFESKAQSIQSAPIPVDVGAPAVPQLKIGSTVIPMIGTIEIRGTNDIFVYTHHGYMKDPQNDEEYIEDPSVTVIEIENSGLDLKLLQALQRVKADHPAEWAVLLASEPSLHVTDK